MVKQSCVSTKCRSSSRAPAASRPRCQASAAPSKRVGSRRDSGRNSLTWVRERQRTAGTRAPATGAMEITSAAAPSDTSEQSERLSGPATKGFFSDGWRQNSKPRSRFMWA